jgi:hypothetical protein
LLLAGNVYEIIIPNLVTILVGMYQMKELNPNSYENDSIYPLSNISLCADGEIAICLSRGSKRAMQTGLVVPRIR